MKVVEFSQSIKGARYTFENFKEILVATRDSYFSLPKDNLKGCLRRRKSTTRRFTIATFYILKQ